MRSLPVIVNPAARGGRVRAPRERLERAAADQGWRLEWWETEAPGHASELAAKAARDRFPAVAAWGGDGTYNEAARGLLDSGTSLIILPGGTTSVLAYELGVPRRAEEALVAQLEGERRAMSVARTDHGQIFLLMMSAGPDAVILQNVPKSWKERGGKLGIAAQAVVEFARGAGPQFSVRVAEFERQCSWCIVGNARCYGGPFAATPGADPFTRGLEVVTLSRHGRSAAVPFFFAIPLRRHLAMRGVERTLAEGVALASDGEVPYQLDGDFAGFLPVTGTASGARLWVHVPRGLAPT